MYLSIKIVIDVSNDSICSITTLKELFMLDPQCKCDQPSKLLVDQLIGGNAQRG